MTGLELSEKLYKEHFSDTLKNDFSDIYDQLAVGLVGSGSECYGYDDEFSIDHDFDCGFSIFYKECTIDRKRLFDLEKAYYKLPSQFEGIRRDKLNPTLKERHGLISIEDFYLNKVGFEYGDLTNEAWLNIPEHYLLEATNGKVFMDNLGVFSEIRAKLSKYPEDITLKKMAGNLLIMSQSGLYNYERCIKHNEDGAAQLSVIEFTKHAMNTIFLLNNQYVPFYKWSFKAMRNLKVLGNLSSSLEFLISSDNMSDNIQLKKDVISDINELIVDEIKKKYALNEAFSSIEALANKLNDMISDIDIRNYNMLSGV